MYIKHSYGKFWKPWRIDFRGFPFGTLFVFTVPGGLDEIFAEPMGWLDDPPYVFFYHDVPSFSINVNPGLINHGLLIRGVLLQ